MSQGDDFKIYSCKPLAKLKIGPFNFKDGLLRLEDAAQIAEMENRLDHIAKTNPGFRHKIKTISVAAAESLIKAKPPEAHKGAAHSDSGVRTVQEQMNPPEQMADASDPIPAIVQDAVAAPSSASSALKL